MRVSVPLSAPEFAREQLVFEIGPTRPPIRHSALKWGTEHANGALIPPWYEIWLYGGSRRPYYTTMFQNYLKTAVRNLLRHPGHSFINVAGLTLGLAGCLIIFQYVAFEYSFDRFNESASELYRINWTRVQNEGTPLTSASTGWAMGPALAEEVPEVARFVRLHPEYDNAIVSNPALPDKTFEEDRVYYADPDIFGMFSYGLLETESEGVLSPGSVVLSETTARKYFGIEDPMGRIIDVRGWISGSFRVGAIVEDVPANSHLQFDILLPMSDLLQRSGFSDAETGWSWTNFITYVQLHAGSDRSTVEQKFTDVLMRHREDDFRETNTTATVSAQPLLDIHLNDAIRAPMAVMGSYTTVYFFSIIGLVTLLIALVNYVNLATARALSRSREVGVRKVVGAYRGQLATQFLFESAITNGMALVLAVALAITIRPILNSLAGTSLPYSIWMNPGFWAAFLSTFGVATLLAGLYPAFVLSSFKPVEVLKAKGGTFASGALLRRTLVVFQFAVSIVLLVGTIIVFRQIGYMRSLDLGIDLEQILTVPAPRVLPENTDRADAVVTFTQELRRLPAVRETTTSFTVPGRGYAFITTTRKETADPSSAVVISGTFIDSSFARFYGLELAAGEGFSNISATVPEGEPRPVIANETAVHAIGFDTPEDAVGQVLGGDNLLRIVGVFKDFNWSSAHRARENAIFLLGRGEPQVSIRVGTDDLAQTIAAIERVYKQLFPDDPFRYAFADVQFDQQYRNDQRFAALFSIFAGLAISIACLGLFGLASYTAQQRTKEIGVRKVLGASVPGIVAMLSKDFLGLVVVAFILATPVAFVIVQRWLDDFAYQVDLPIWTFALAGVAALGIAFLTICYQSIRAAMADPVKSLRYE